MLKTTCLIISLIFSLVVFENCSNSDKSRSTVNGEKTNIDSAGIVKLLDSAYAARDEKPEVRLKYINKALEQSRNLGYKLLEADALSKLGKAHYDTGINIDSAILYYRSALRINDAEKYKHGMARDRLNLSIAYKNKGKYDSSIVFANKAAEIWKTVPGKESDLNRALLAAANTMRRKSQFDLALKNIYTAVDVAQKSNNARLLSDALEAAGQVYFAQKQYESALSEYEKCLEINKKNNFKLDIAKSHNNIATVLIVRGELDTALYNLNQAMAIYEELQAESKIANTGANLAIYNQLKGEYDLAEKWNEKSMQLYSRMGSAEGIAIAYFNRGTIELKRNNKSKAIEYFLKCDSIATSIGNIGTQIESALMISDLYADSKDYLKAYEYMNKGSAIRDTIDARTQRANVLALAYKEEQNKRILLEKERDQQKAQIEKVYLLIIALAVIIILLLVLILLQLRTRRAEKRNIENKVRIEEMLRNQEQLTFKTMLETQTKERKRIAQDLHDSLGVKLSAAKLVYNLMEKESSGLPTGEFEQLKKANLVLDEACEEIRHVASSLHSGGLTTFGLEKAIEGLCEKIEIAGTIKVEYHTGGNINRLDSITEFNIYQIVQELLANVLRHSQATELTVQLQRQNGTLNLIVEDNGVGFDIAKTQGNGIGMKSLHERAKNINATLTIDSRPGHGTTVTLDIPVH
ncbi:MAG: tetratricopeptide repeat protein [Bacteroidota bacterium]|jgi:two-component system NarL family sensor kinase